MTDRAQQVEEQLEAAATEIERLTNPLTERLRALAQQVAAADAAVAVAVAEHDDDRWRAVVAAGVETTLTTEPLALGAGVAVGGRSTEAGRSPEAMAWWIRRQGIIRVKRHVLNPQSDSFYDFTQMRWFALPASTGRTVLSAPFVDSWGTDDVTMTLSVPMALTAGRVAIVAADLDVRSYLQQVETVLQPLVGGSMLDEEGRVIVSRHPALDPGTRLAQTLGSGFRPSRPVADRGWSVVAVPTLPAGR